MPSPILVIDHGSAVAKTCLVKGDEFASHHIPLGFKSSEHLSVLESILYIIKQVEKLEKIKILDGEKKVRIPVYVSGDIASTELEGTLKDLPISGVDALCALNMGIVDVGHEFTYVRFFREAFQSESAEVRSLFLTGLVARAKLDVEKILSWISFDISPIWVKNYLANKELYPQVVPENIKALRIEQAVAKERIADTVSRVDLNKDEIWQEEHNLVATGGVLSCAPRGAQVVSMILDGLKPLRTVRIYWDKRQLVPCIGTLKHFDQKEGEKLTRRIDFECLATVVNVPVGSLITIDFGLKNVQEVKVVESELLLFPLEKGKQAELRVETPNTGEFSSLMEGGNVGLVVDARGRPLERPSLSSRDRELLNSWDKALNVYGKRVEI